MKRTVYDWTKGRGHAETRMRKGCGRWVDFIASGCGWAAVSLTALLAIPVGLTQARSGVEWGDGSAAARDKMAADPSKLYEQAKGLKVEPRFIQLPPGAVRPAGWLADWATAAAEGIVGDLDTRSVTFREAWKGTEFLAWRAPEDKEIYECMSSVGWPLEQGAYWLDGLVRLAYILDDPLLKKKAQARLDPVVAGVLQGGPSLIHWKPLAQLDHFFENWAHGHLARALLAYYQASGDPRILQALVRVYRHYALPLYDGSGHGQVNGIINLGPMVDTYLLSGDAQVLENILAVTRRDGFQKVIEQWNQGKPQTGHAVIFYENIILPATLYPLTGERRYLDATLKALDWLEAHHGQPYGVASGQEYHAGISSIAKTETCNISSSLWDYIWLTRLDGDRAHGDRIEQIFFNAAAASISRGFKVMTYYQSPNRLNLHEPRQTFSALGVANVLCCVGNCTRQLPYYIQHMWMGTPDQGLAATLYGPCEVRSVVAGKVPVRIYCDTHYPFATSIRMTITPQKKIAFPLYLRLPAWSANPVIEVNGRAVKAKPDAQGYTKVERVWRPGDVLCLELPMGARWFEGWELSQPEGKPTNPYACVYYGPLLMALPVPDADPNTPIADARWNYALDVDAARKDHPIQVVRSAMPGKWQWQLDAPIQLRVPARQFDWHPTPAQPLPKEPVKDGQSATITLVPYGCTKFRVSMFPMAWRHPPDR